MALVWDLVHEGISSVLIGASKLSQILDNVNCLQQASFTPKELTLIDSIALSK